MPTKNTKEVAEPAQAKPPARPEFQRLAEILEEEHNLFEPGASARIPAPEPGSDAADHDRKLEGDYCGDSCQQEWALRALPFRRRHP